MSDTLKTYLKAQVKQYSNDLYEEVLVHCTTKLAARNEILLRPGQVCKELYFIENGCIRTFRVRKSGVENTLDFNFEGTFTIVNPSFLSQKASGQYIEAIEKSELLAINYKNFICLESIIPDFHWSRQIVLIDKMFKVHDELKEMSALERYVWLLQNRPNIIQRLSNDLTASYLGITTRTLGRVRAQLKKVNLKSIQDDMF